jgi:hypothetical protein
MCPAVGIGAFDHASLESCKFEREASVFCFDSASYGTTVAELLAGAPLNELGPGQPARGLESRLRPLTGKELLKPHNVADRDMARCCLAGLWLRHDFLDESHQISQGIATASGSFWHGIMHRREPDYSNAKYWFRRVGNHEIYDRLAAESQELARAADAGASAAYLLTQSEWDPFQFVDLCQATAGSGSPAERLARDVARQEWELLFDFCYRRARGG